MQIRTSARRHGIADPDIHQAIDDAVAAGPVETDVDQIVGVLSIGPDRTGRMLEVITVDDVDDGDVAVDAMRLREAYERELPSEDRSLAKRRSDPPACMSPTNWLDDELADLLEQRADRDGVHKSDVVRDALRAYLV